MTRGIRPVDRLVFAFNALAVLLWLPLMSFPVGRWIALTHGVALVLPSLIRRLHSPGRLTAILLEVYPLLWISAFWSSLGLRHALISTASNDTLAMAVDRWLFGEHLNLSLIARLPDPAISETMHGFYFAYYLMLVGVPGLLLLSSCRVTVRELVLRMSATYLACFSIYLVFPVVGPLEMFPRFGGTFTEGLFYQINSLIRAGGDSLGTAFPSSHVAGSVTLAWIAWRRCARPLAFWCSVTACMVVVATVYTQNHFAVDALAGVGVAVLAQGVLVPFLGGESFVRQPTYERGSFVLFPQGVSRS
jgi:membrane-associated phospholipid phosphatase